MIQSQLVKGQVVQEREAGTWAQWLPALGAGQLEDANAVPPRLRRGGRRCQVDIQVIGEQRRQVIELFGWRATTSPATGPSPAGRHIKKPVT
jgi:hypothetical protein